jgi:hypothetical protein
LLELGLRSNVRIAPYTYAAYWLRRGKLAERIRTLEESKPDNTEQRAGMLAILNRIQGDFPKARAAVDKAKHEGLLYTVLFDQGDWKQFADQVAKTSGESDDPNSLSLLARYQRLAGNRKAADETVTRIRENAKRLDHQESARALLLIERPQDALPLIHKGFGQPWAVQMYVARAQLKEALQILEDKGPRDPQFSPEYFEIMRARILCLLGDRDNAVKLFRRLHDKVGNQKGVAPGGTQRIILPDNLTLLLQTEVQLGLKSLAFEYLDAVAARYQEDKGTLSRCLAVLYPSRGYAATTWWLYFRQVDPKAEPSEITKRMRDVVEGRMTLKEFTPIAENAIERAPASSPARRREWYLTIADSCLDMGADALLKDCLEMAAAAANPPRATGRDPAEVDDWPPPIAPFVGLGDYYARKKDGAVPPSTTRRPGKSLAIVPCLPIWLALVLIRCQSIYRAWPSPRRARKRKASDSWSLPTIFRSQMPRCAMSLPICLRRAVTRTPLV